LKLGAFGCYLADFADFFNSDLFRMFMVASWENKLVKVGCSFDMFVFNGCKLRTLKQNVLLLQVSKVSKV